MNNLHSYHILKNSKYWQGFQYCSASIEPKQRMQFIKDKNNADENNLYQSDLVKMAFEIPYMPKEMRDKFKFDEKSYT